MDRLFAEGSPEDVYGLSERCTGVLLVGVRPEQAEQGVAPVITSGLGDAEVGEEGNALRLGEKRMKLSPIVRT
jgi:hypothetical protein